MVYVVSTPIRTFCQPVGIKPWRVRGTTTEDSALMNLPHEEDLRLKAVASLELLDKPEEERFQRIVRLVRRHFQAAAGAITLLDKERAYYLAQEGLQGRQSPRSKSLCSQVVKGKQPVVIAEHSEDSQSPLYRELTQRLNLSFYAGMPILTPDGYAVGALCVMDHIPRKFSRRELESLADFAAIVQDEILIKQAAQTNRELISQVEKLRIRAFIDPLTSVWNRGAIFDLLQRELHRSRRTGQSLSLCMLDLDHFKTFNDKHGHQVGDAVLQEMCRRVRQSVRPYDALGRYGGEEFLLVFPETDLSQACTQAERVREAIGGTPFELSDTVSETVTISIGVAQVDSNEDIDKTIERADKALYEAKRSGRNKVIGRSEEE